MGRITYKQIVKKIKSGEIDLTKPVFEDGLGGKYLFSQWGKFGAKQNPMVLINEDNILVTYRSYNMDDEDFKWVGENK